MSSAFGRKVRASFKCGGEKRVLNDFGRALASVRSRNADKWIVNRRRKILSVSLKYRIARLQAFWG